LRYIPDEWVSDLETFLSKGRVRTRLLLRRLVPPMSRESRAEVQIHLRDASKPDFDYFVLVLLSCMIATFGLLTDSAATIIGAMLVAPLMSPILGLGLASIRGDTLLLRNAAAALIRGAVMAVLLSTVLTWFNAKLPFISLQELPAEVISRTQPTPIDLGIALAGGLAAAFALAQPQLSAALPGVAIATALMPPLCTIGVGIALNDWGVAGGAFLLFITNAVTIAAASIFVFFALGFNPPRKDNERFIPRSLLISSALSLVLLAPLGIQSYLFVKDATLRAHIDEVVKARLAEIPGAEAELVFSDFDQPDKDTISLEITVRSIASLSYRDSVSLQEAIAADLQKTVQLQINHIYAARLDPAVPPTLTATATLGPSPTFTKVIPTKTATLTPTPTYTHTPTHTATFTVTPSLLILINTYGGSVYLREFPNGPAIAHLEPGTQLLMLYGYQIVDGWVWIEVLDPDGRQGWIPQFYTQVITLTPTDTPAASPTSLIPAGTPTPSPTAAP